MISDSELDDLDAELRAVPNVIGVAKSSTKQRPVALVSRKLPEADLDDDDLVENNTERDVGVLEISDVRAHATDPDPDSAAESGDAEPNADAEPDGSAGERAEGDDVLYDPDANEAYEHVPAGAEEQPSGERWVGTGGPIARVVNDRITSANTEWADEIGVDDIVRLSNWHVYVGDPNYDVETRRRINHPYGGRRVGQLDGFLRLSDGVRIDAAARSVTDEDGWGVAELTDPQTGDYHDQPAAGPLGRNVIRSVGEQLVGTPLVKSGRTTGVTRGEVKAVGARIRVSYSHGKVVVNDCIVASSMSNSGDSGAPIYVDDGFDPSNEQANAGIVPGALLGLNFAGSDTTSVFSEIGNVERDLGVEIITDWSGDTPPVEYTPEPVAPDEPSDGGDTGNSGGGSSGGSDGGSDDGGANPGEPRPGDPTPDDPQEPDPGDGRLVARGRAENPGAPHPFGIIDTDANAEIAERDYHDAVQAWLESTFESVEHERYFSSARRFADFVVGTAPDNPDTDPDEGLWYAIEVENGVESVFEAAGQALVYAGLLRREDGRANVSPLIILPTAAGETIEVNIIRSHIPVVEFPVERTDETTTETDGETSETNTNSEASSTDSDGNDADADTDDRGDDS